MEPLEAATVWAREELFSALFFVFFGLIFALAAMGFWQLGKTDMAKAFVIPTLVAGVLILTVGLGLSFNNRSRLAQFETDYSSDASAFVESEIARAEKTMTEFQTIVLKVIPIIVAIAALLIIFLNGPIWRAASITTIAMMAVLLLVDINANARIEAYKNQLVAAAETIQTE